MDMTWERLIAKMHKIRNDWSVIDWLYHVFYFVKDKITALEERCTALEARCTALEQRVVEIFEEITGLKEKDEEQDEAIDNITKIAVRQSSFNTSYGSFTYNAGEYKQFSITLSSSSLTSVYGICCPCITLLTLSTANGSTKSYSQTYNSSTYYKICQAIDVSPVDISDNKAYISILFKYDDLLPLLGFSVGDEVGNISIYFNIPVIGCE